VMPAPGAGTTRHHTPRKRPWIAGSSPAMTRLGFVAAVMPAKAGIQYASEVQSTEGGGSWIAGSIPGSSPRTGPAMTRLGFVAAVMPAKAGIQYASELQSTEGGGSWIAGSSRAMTTVA